MGKPALVRFTYYNEEAEPETHEVEAVEEGGDIAIRFDDRWYHNVDELWQRTVDAYHMNDIKALAELEVLVRKALGDLGSGKIKVQIPDIDDRIDELRKEIETIRTTTPYTYLSLIEDSDAVERKKKEHKKELEDYKTYREELRKVIDDLFGRRENHTIMAQEYINKPFHIIALQKKTYASPRQNIDAVKSMLDSYDGPEADFVMLPEIFTCPYDNSCFPRFAESGGGETFQFLADLARERRAYVIGGSIPELDNGKIYNTSYVFDRSGELIGKHRKVHLFDIDVKGGQYFKESDVLSPGREITVFDTEFGKMGVCICFDIRFPDLFIKMRKAGVKMVFVPAAFNMTTGPAHWETLFKSRALDQQIYVLGCSPARDERASYVAYGHSILTDPWGSVVCELGAEEGVLSAQIDLERVESVRQQIPLGAAADPTG